MHTPVTRKVFEYFNCHNVSGVSFLRAAYTINCWTSSKWLTFLSYIIIVGGSFSIGFPLLVSIYLLRNWKNLHSAKLLARTGFLYIDLTRGAELWEVHEIARKTFLTGVLIYFQARPQIQIAFGIIVCLFAECTLNYFKPQKDRAVFILA